ncbi:hypothetical protein HYH02_013393 [Chlamydomonas schloesseri]|uniref:protein-L-isoaspartate(D-aspartate) O-methyltransferase n=1 Tax=Chlamydomonas schloesseri TaxID=2026947 RepID=A0A835SQD0_9CHLO|nr:hypothetical protein HYH02_013393 [Chlamydomonas schloesseri]|eukprot:KAG2431259.1 hypothetical protein HYH02_013393 [Chlamydomonas schloesseri]
MVAALKREFLVAVGALAVAVALGLCGGAAAAAAEAAGPGRGMVVGPGGMRTGQAGTGGGEAGGAGSGGGSGGGGGGGGGDDDGCGGSVGEFSGQHAGARNARMVAGLKRAGLVKSPEVEEAMLAVDRGLFVPEGQFPYQDAPQPLGCGATISAPHMHAVCLELLAAGGQLRPGARVLDVGSGSGYLALVLAAMVAPPTTPSSSGGKVVGVEHIGELVGGSVAAARRVGGWARRLLSEDRLRLEQGDGFAGYAAWAPFDAIHVGAAAPAVPPALVAQLAPGGRMVLPVGPEGGPQALVVVDKDAGGHVTSRREMGVMYVPLTTEHAQRSRAGSGAVWRGPLPSALEDDEGEEQQQGQQQPGRGGNSREPELTGSGGGR